ncbi:hypothetical protein GGI02_003377, partial [Coemansia sp. RSA 2322]
MPFTQIPTLVVSQIVGYLEGNMKLFEQPFNVSKTYKQVYHPLLSLSRDWRHEVLNRMGKECDITIEHPVSNSTSVFPRAPRDFAPIEYQASMQVRTVNMRLNCQSLVNGEAFGVLTSFSHPTFVFPFATNLNIELFTTEMIDVDDDEKEVLKCAQDTANAIKAMMPFNCSFCIDDRMSYPIIDSVLCRALGLLVQTLFSGAAKTQVCYNSFIDDMTKYDSVAALTHI